ncbi:MAG TPA: GNAT family N-acetyltransferase, partial [Cyanophyceae cyanobacterium]
PQEIGLYRMLSAQLTLEATKRGFILHQSSGAASFKRFRGFVGTIEYSAVFYQHLPFWRQLVWRLLGLLVNKIAVPLMQKYKL